MVLIFLLSSSQVSNNMAESTTGQGDGDGGGESFLSSRTTISHKG